MVCLEQLGSVCLVKGAIKSYYSQLECAIIGYGSISIYQALIQFEWDEAKNLENIRKHQIDFVDVPEIFESVMLVELDDRIDYGEERWVGIGFLRNGVVVVVWTERQDDVIRIISARKANRYERRRFQQYLTY